MYMYVCLHPVLYNSNHKHVGTISCLLEAKDKNNETVYIQCAVRGCLHDTGGLSPRSEFIPVPSHGSIFVYMIPPQNVMPA